MLALPILREREYSYKLPLTINAICLKYSRNLIILESLTTHISLVILVIFFNEYFLFEALGILRSSLWRLVLCASMYFVVSKVFSEDIYIEPSTRAKLHISSINPRIHRFLRSCFPFLPPIYARAQVPFRELISPQSNALSELEA